MRVISRDAARAEGLKYYFTGEPCRRGHVDRRVVRDGRCWECFKAWRRRPEVMKKLTSYSRGYREANKDKVRAFKGAWRERNRDKTNAREREKRAFNPEPRKRAQKKFYENNKRKVIESNKKWQKRNPERYRGLLRAAWSRRRARKRGAVGSHNAAQLLDLLRKQKERCMECKKKIRKGWTVDHVMPLSKGGSNDIKNIQLLCRPCNTRKNAKHPLVWARDQGRLL